MRPAAVVVQFLAAVLFTASSASAQADTATIHTSASATVSVPAQYATVSVEFTAGGRTPYAAGQAVAERANAIRAALIAIGIGADSVTSQRRWGWWGNRSGMQLHARGTDTTYVTTDAMRVRVRDIELVGAAIDTVLAEGAQTVSNVQFGADETTEARLSALALATREARASAEAIATAGGGRLGRVVELTTERNADGGWGLSSIVPTAFSASGERTTVVAPQVDITVTVYGRWLFVPSP